MKEPDNKIPGGASESGNTRIILVGANDPLPSDHFWFEGNGYSIYAAEQPRSTWSEHVHDCVQVTIGLEPAHVHTEWRAGTRTTVRRELSGNGVSIIPSGEPHRTLWQRRASLVHIYLSNELIARIGLSVLQEKNCELRAAYLVRDLLIEELGRALFRECNTGKLNTEFAASLMTVLVTHLLRTYSASPETSSDVRGGLGPARERRIREYIEESLDRDLSIAALAEVVGMSHHYFADLFHQTTGFTPHQYVSHRRVARAQQLLLDTEVTLADVAYRCGFTSQSQFTTLFRRFAGVTPGRFRSDNTVRNPGVSETGPG
jgi:AraC family transcriptional regulator